MTRLSLPAMPPAVLHVPVPVNLRRLFPQASFVGCCDLRVTDATENSGQCRPGSLFAVIRGSRADGRNHVREAIDRGAQSLLVDHPLAEARVPQCVVPDVRRAYSELCHSLLARPSSHMALAGVTGTNGKTTTTWLMRSILKAAGHATGLLGTIEYHDGAQAEGSRLTTPDSATLARWLSRMVSRGTTHAAMELSSHALDQRRAAGTKLDAAVITNITQDHFDYHREFGAYRSSKLRIFEALKTGGLAIVNVDDAGSRSCLADAPLRTKTYAIDQPADVSAQILEATVRGTSFRLHLGDESLLARTRLVGRHNVSNCLAAAAAASHLGATPDAIVQGIAELACVPGRMERVEGGQPFEVFVDYAHTEDALRHAIRSLRPLTAGRILCVFGAGGDRDRTKRPLLGRAAAEADLPVITSDNSRSEDSQAIAHDILQGFEAGRRTPFVELDREQAIRWALQHAGPGDSVLIAGKGHETEQIVGADRRHFDDREVAREYLSAAFPAGHRGSPHLSLRNSLTVT